MCDCLGPQLVGAQSARILLILPPEGCSTCLNGTKLPRHRVTRRVSLMLPRKHKQHLITLGLLFVQYTPMSQGKQEEGDAKDQQSLVANLKLAADVDEMV